MLAAEGYRPRIDRRPCLRGLVGADAEVTQALNITGFGRPGRGVEAEIHEVAVNEVGGVGINLGCGLNIRAPVRKDRAPHPSDVM